MARVTVFDYDRMAAYIAKHGEPPTRSGPGGGAGKGKGVSGGGARAGKGKGGVGGPY